MVIQRLSDRPIIPFNVVEYAERIKEEITKLKDSKGAEMMKNNISFFIIDQYADQLYTAATNLMNAIRSIDDSTSESYIRYMAC